MNPCPYCGTTGHTGTCWRVKAIEYFPNGSVKRVELHETLQVTASSISPMLAVLPEQSQPPYAAER